MLLGLFRELFFRKIVLTNAAKWAKEIFWEVFKSGAWSDAVIWVANFWVINPTAYITNVLHVNFGFKLLLYN